jgi:hypothetical protein
MFPHERYCVRGARNHCHDLSASQIGPRNVGQVSAHPTFSRIAGLSRNSMANARNPLTAQPITTHQYQSIFPSLSPHAKKKADVVAYPKVRHHVGLLVNGSPGTAELSFIKSSDDF